MSGTAPSIDMWNTRKIFYRDKCFTDRFDNTNEHSARSLNVRDPFLFFFFIRADMLFFWFYIRWPTRNHFEKSIVTFQRGKILIWIVILSLPSIILLGSTQVENKNGLDKMNVPLITDKNMEFSSSSHFISIFLLEHIVVDFRLNTVFWKKTKKSLVVVYLSSILVEIHIKLRSTIYSLVVQLMKHFA